MNKYTIEYNGTWERISKRTARKHLLEGRQICILPCKMRPSGWLNPVVVSKEEMDSFDAYVNGYEYYNCMHETGRYASFYAREGE